MKLRIKGNSVRLRLTRNELIQLANAGLVEETTEFGLEQKLIYQLKATDAETVSAAFEQGRIMIFVPEPQISVWANTEQVGVEAAQPLGDDKMLRILIEKDFACSDRRDGEDDRDAFPHPAEDKTC